MGEKSEVIIELFGFLDVTGEVIGMWIILGIRADSYLTICLRIVEMSRCVGRVN